MKCPHCRVAVNESWTDNMVTRDNDYPRIALQTMTCPDCRRFVVQLGRTPAGTNIVLPITVYPRNAAVREVAPEVPEPYSTDHREAAEVLPISPKASAALSRRVLQAVLRDAAKVKHGNLDSEIDQVIQMGLPTHLSEALDAVRVIGNFAAHPMKSQTTSAVVEVEPGEAEWLLDVNDGLFDYYFVQPAVLKKKKDALNAKLQDLGKPPLK